MEESRKYVLQQTLFILLGELVCVALMCGVYALLSRFALPVLLGGIVGALVAVGNFFFMAMIATLAADRAQQQDVDGGKKLLSSSYPLRLLAMAAILGLCAFSGWFDILALVLPLIFVRPIITVTEFFKKKGA
jgi:hypothetical protein